MPNTKALTRIALLFFAASPAGRRRGGAVGPAATAAGVGAPFDLRGATDFSGDG